MNSLTQAVTSFDTQVQQTRNALANRAAHLEDVGEVRVDPRQRLVLDDVLPAGHDH